MNRSLLFLLLLFSLISCKEEVPIRVACVGDSITEGYGIPEPGMNAYPAQLGTLLGPGYEVKNFGLGGRTMLHKGDMPYVEEEAYQLAQDFAPQIVVIKLGTNDAKPYNWLFKDDFMQNYTEMIETFREAGTERILICLPVPVYGSNFDITAEIVHNEVIPLVRDIAQKLEVELVDLFIPLSDHPEWFPDCVHPNREGATQMAEVLSLAILEK